MMIELLKATNVNGVPTYTVEKVLRGIGVLAEAPAKSIGGGGTDAPVYVFTSSAQIQANRMVRINGKRLKVQSGKRGISGYSIYKAAIDG